MNIAGLNKAAVLAALYNGAAEPKGWGRMYWELTPMTGAEAASWLGSNGSGLAQSIKGRGLNVDLSGDVLDISGYDAENGPGAAARALSSLLATTGGAS